MPSITFNVAGTVRWICPANVTSIQVECWAAGAGGFNAPLPFNAGGNGGGGGEYAAETSLPVTPGMTFYGQIGQGGAANGGAGGNTTWNSGQVTAHGGSGSNGGSGSSNSVHHNGGAGGAGGSGVSFGVGGGGGGGGGSGAPAANGNAGSAGSAGSVGGAGGSGGAALSSGGAGGRGGNSQHTGSRGGAPGGGGGGGGGGSAGAGGGAGQIRITWTSAPGSPSSFPLPAIPFFPAGFAPSQSDLNAWFHDPLSFLETRAVFRARQAVTPQALPSSGVATVLQWDTIDEDPLGGWVPGAFAWGPPPGFSAWYGVTVTLFTAALAAGNVIRPGITAPGAPSTNGALATGYPGAAVAGVEGSYWVYLIGGQDTVQATGTLLNAASNVNTDITFGQQSSIEVTWLSS